MAVGEMLYRVDDRQYPFVYAVSATLEVRDPDGMVLAVLEPGQFTGEMGLLLGQTSCADCIAVESGEVVLVAPLDHRRPSSSRSEGALVSHVANGAKHCRVCPGRHTTVSATVSTSGGFQGSAFQSSAFQVARLVIELEDGRTRTKAK